MKNSTLFFLLVFLSISGYIRGQSSPDLSEKELEKTVQNYYQAFSAFTKGETGKENLLKFIAKKATYNLNFFGADHRYSRLVGQFDDLANRFDYFINHNITINFNIQNILATRIRGNIGVVSLLVEEEQKFHGETLIKSTQQSTLVLKYFGAIWKVLDISGSILEDERFKGNCACEIYRNSAQTNRIILKVSAPFVNNYNTNYHFVEIEDTGKGNRMINAEDHLFQWAKNGDIKAYSGNNDKGVALGSADNINAAIELVVLNSLYTSNCKDLLIKE